jgi:hypothetical protein
LKQITIGKAVSLTRETVNRKLKDLVEWGYVEKQEVTGRALWYRVIMDRGAPPDLSQQEIAQVDSGTGDNADENDFGDLQKAHDSVVFDVSDGSHVGYNPTSSACPPLTSDESTADHSSCDRTQSHRTTSLTTLSNDPPPLSPARGGRGRGKVDEVDETLRKLIGERPGEDARRFAVDVVLRPIVVSRKFDAASFEHGLRILADWIASKSLSAAEGVRIVERILDTRRATVKPSDIQDEVKAVLGYRPQRPVLAGDEMLMKRWPSLLEALKSLIGSDKVNGWFSTIVVVGASDQRLELETHLPHVPPYIDQEFRDQLRWALSQVYGVSKFSLIATRASA